MGVNQIEIITDPEELARITEEVLADEELLAAAENMREFLMIYLEYWLEGDGQPSI